MPERAASARAATEARGLPTGRPAKLNATLRNPYDRYGHLFPEADTMAAAKLDAIRTTGLGIKLG